MPKGFVHLAAAAALLLCGAAGVESCLPGSQGPGRVGTHTCLACHDGRSAPDQREFLRGPHRGIACEDCHGPGLAHVRAGGRGGLLIDNPARDPFSSMVNLCARCHEDTVNGYQATAHFAAEAAACSDCHDVHRRGGMRFSTPNNTLLDIPGYNRVCRDCHGQQTQQFMLSVHAQKGVASCGSCHNPHAPRTLTAMTEDNRVCQQCHASSFLGLDTEAAVDFHTGAFHPVDPEGSGASRCTACHMPPLRRTGQQKGPRDHTMFTVPPAASNEAIAQGRTPMPNSCAGIMGCHDAAVPGSGTPYNVDNPNDNAALQVFYEQIGGIPQ
jgi:predicted CXXCH cytochrome family protein